MGRFYLLRVYNHRIFGENELRNQRFHNLRCHKTASRALAKAAAYALNEKPYLYTFLENRNVPIDNNRAENAIRPFAVGRKNWMHCNTANGAKASAALYSIVATAQANGLNTEQYLTELFSQPAGTILLPFNT